MNNNLIHIKNQNMRLVMNNSLRVCNYGKQRRKEIVNIMPILFPYINNPDYEDKINAIKAYPINICFINYPNLYMLELATGYGTNLSVLRLLNPNIMESALISFIESYPEAFYYLIHQTYDIAIAAISAEYSNYNYINKELFTLRELSYLKAHYNRESKIQQNPFNQQFNLFMD